MGLPPLPCTAHMVGDSHSLPLHQFHIVFGAGVVLIGAQGAPEVGPELAMAGKHRSDHLPTENTGAGWASVQTPHPGKEGSSRV